MIHVFHFSFFIFDISLIIYIVELSLSLCVSEVVVEESVSGISQLGHSFYIT